MKYQRALRNERIRALLIRTTHHPTWIVLAGLALHSDEMYETNVSLDTLAKLTHYSRSHLRRVLPRMVKAGMLTVDTRPGHPSTYRLAPPTALPQDEHTSALIHGEHTSALPQDERALHPKMSARSSGARRALIWDKERAHPTPSDLPERAPKGIKELREGSDAVAAPQGRDDVANMAALADVRASLAKVTKSTP